MALRLFALPITCWVIYLLHFLQLARLKPSVLQIVSTKEPERVRKLLQGSANLEFWETYTAREVLPALQAADAKLRTVLAEQAPAEKAEETQAPAAEKAVNAADSLAAALKGNTAEKEEANLEELKKQYPLLSILQLNSSGQGPVVGYANYKDTAEINKLLAMPEVKAELPRDLSLKWGVSAAEFDKKNRFSNCILLRLQNATVKLRWKVT